MRIFSASSGRQTRLMAGCEAYRSLGRLQGRPPFCLETNHAVTTVKVFFLKARGYQGKINEIVLFFEGSLTQCRTADACIGG
jgi:hypothetical protein